MLRIRLQRLGRHNRPFYRIGAIDIRTRREGAMVENLGWYDPVASDKSKQVHLKSDRIQHWLSKGAVPSETVRDLLGKADLLPERMKAEWEADRKHARLRVEKKKAAAAAAAAPAEGDKPAG
ncbi:MAG: 30S ribosomal protein S16 [Phycisphaeraceae bacterium]|nr:30S ribosomal protein S16 [Phycisphaeraceae bacterium]MCW5754531.1 30S ribosomal protein S16 [Phycisphaeraceae bacterium]